MAEFIKVGSLVIEFTEFRRLKPELVGTMSRAYNGDLRSQVRAGKLAWQGTTRPYPVPDADDIRDACAFGTFVNAYGTALGVANDTTAILVAIEEEDEPYTIDAEDTVYGYQVSLTLTFREA